MAERFDFPYHTFRTIYPESGTRVQFGKGYVFAARPDSPVQRRFVLKMTGMQYFVGENDEIDTETMPQRNMGRLQAFYEEHELWKSFVYPHPVLGDVLVKFNKPLDIPEGIIGGNGVLPEFEIELIEQP